MNRNTVSVLKRQDSILATHKVLRNTYLLLSLCFMFSAFTAYLAFTFQVAPVGLLTLIVGTYGLMFLTYKFSESSLGILFVFAFTGFLGYTLGPVLNLYMAHYANGAMLVSTALGTTGLVFFALSGYVLMTRKDFSFMAGFLFVGMMVALVGMVASLFFNLPALNLAIAGLFVLLSSGVILFQTSAIIHGGETNYIRATVGLFVSLYNLFLSLLRLISAFSGRD